ncbi:MAG: hypothetical protein M3N11_01390, partial [Actinomycetota bacterium]|nr:hypothetical protein [Actinomycetota bacterium]
PLSCLITCRRVITATQRMISHGRGSLMSLAGSDHPLETRRSVSILAAREVFAMRGGTVPAALSREEVSLLIGDWWRMPW